MAIYGSMINKEVPTPPTSPDNGEPTEDITKVLDFEKTMNTLTQTIDSTLTERFDKPSDKSEEPHFTLATSPTNTKKTDQ